MAYHDHCDERAKKFYERGFVGSSHGDDGTSHSTSWSSRNKELKPTKCLSTNRITICAYCGNQALPIQHNIELDIRRSNYDITGYTCCCTSAMDEIEYQVKLEELFDRHNQEVDELEKLTPKISEEVQVKLLAKLHEKSSVSDLMDRFNVKVSP